MMFLQSAMLWGLGVAALPILIHLLNRLRYRTVPWGAMMFLLRVTRSATKRSRIRHYLILACRTLALAALALAMARPLVDGWLGGLGRGGAPDAVVILFDRSASMEQTVLPGVSRRQQALDILADTPTERVQGSRIILLDSAYADPREMASPAALPDLDWTRATDTAADWPVLLDRALDWVERHRPGRTEFWVVTDAQASNWRTGSGVWQDVRDRFSEIQPPVTLRMLLIGGGETPADNMLIQARPARRMAAGSFALPYQITAPGPLDNPLPAALLTQDARTLLSLPIAAAVTEGEARVAAPDGTGWAGIELPADTLSGDNTAWYAFAPPTEGGVRLYAEDEALRARVRNAFRPARAVDPHPVERWARRDEQPPLNDTALVIWQGQPPDGDAAAALIAYLENGGVVLALPPVEDEARTDEEVGTADAWRWTARDEASLEQPWRLVRWESATGPFARTTEGDNLPLAESAVQMRRAFETTGAQTVYEQAFYNDQAAALWRAHHGSGRIYALGTLPLRDWSELGDGRVWVPFLWRLRAEGGLRLGYAQQGVVGEWSPTSSEDQWEAVAPELYGDPTIQAGVYRLGSQWLALNRPTAEDDPTFIEPDDLRALLPDVRIDITALGTGAVDAAAADASLALLILAAAFFSLEALLCLGLHDRVRSAADTSKEVTA